MEHRKRLVALIDYYLECLAQERRDLLTVLESQLEQSVIPLVECRARTWQEVLGGTAGATVIQRLRERPNRVALYAPYGVVTTRGTRHEPLVGVFCALLSHRLVPDPADLWVSGFLSAELSEEDLQTIRDRLERSVRNSPEAFQQALQRLLEEQGLPAPHACPDFETLKRLPEGTIAHFPALWVVEIESQYDRGLIRDLKKLREAMLEDRVRLTALDALAEPSRSVSITPLQVLQAYANPATPTFSQAQAIAHGLNQPIAVITGPPGTGKTRVIGAVVIEHLLQGKSVLIASKINTAVDTAVAMVDRLLGAGALLRTGNQEARTQLADLTNSLATWKHWQGVGELLCTPQPRSPQAQATLMRQLQPTIKRLEQATQHLKASAAYLATYDPTRPPRWWQWRLKWHLKRFEQGWKLLTEHAEQLLGYAEQWRALRLAELHRALNRLVKSSHSPLARVAKAINRDSRTRHRLFEALASKGYPIAVSSLSVSTNLPMEPALFDLVIIDEASTCDPASLLPLLYRAKRAMIVGDPQQLPHITGEGWRQVSPVPVLLSVDGEPVRAEFGISAYELCRQMVGGQEHAFLHDHFRCPPQIIGFANAKFYGGNLRIHTPEQSESVELRLVEGRHIGTKTGSRLNPAQEAEALQVMEQFLQTDPQATYGIVVPYRASADALIKQVSRSATLSPLWYEGRLLIGTAHRFQGNEVDYLVFATIVGRNATERDLRWVEQPNLFNVAITRARRKLVLIVDPTLWQEHRLPLVRGLINASVVMVDTYKGTYHTLLESIRAFLEANGIPCHLNAVYRGYHLDVLDATSPPRWAINLFDWEHLQALTPVEALGEWLEQEQLQRHGVHLMHVNPLGWRVRLARWLAEQELPLLQES